MKSEIDLMGPEWEKKKMLSLPEDTLNLYWKAIGLHKDRKHFLKVDFILKNLSSLETLHGHEERWASLGEIQDRTPTKEATISLEQSLCSLSVEGAWEHWPHKAKASA